MKPVPLALAASLFASALAACAIRADGAHDALGELAAAMTGTFSSRAQHLAAPDDYYDIRLVMVPIWSEREDGPWLYVEQAVAETAERPYRQRVYRLVALDGGETRSDVYTLPGDPLAFAGAWRHPDLLGELAPEQLDLREGCSVFLSPRPGGGWSGGTRGRGCASERGGASYATSEVALDSASLASWDRGFDEAGVQVWGATEGPYVFDRLSDEAPR